MALTPDFNDKKNDLLYKLAKNLYDLAVGVGATGVEAPIYGSNDHAHLKNAVQNTALIVDSIT